MSQNDQDILYFVAFCLESFKNKHGIRGEEASEMFDKYGVKQYLVKTTIYSTLRVCHGYWKKLMK